MSVQLVTYSGKDLNFGFSNPNTGSIQAAGVSGQGLAQLTIRMGVDQSSVQVGMDGAVATSVIPGDQGEIEIQVWQTSSLHQEFLAAYNILKAARDAGDVSEWFGGKLMIQNIVDGSQHQGNGAAFKKVPDKVYGEQAGRVSWVFVCANIVNQ